MKSKYLAMLILFLGMTGCVTIIKWKYGITNPKEQNPQKLCAFLKKHNYPEVDQYLFNDSASYFRAFRNEKFRKNLFSHMIFDRAGALIERDTNRCQWSGYDVIKTLNPDSAYRIIPGLRAEQFLADLHPLDTIAGPDSLQRQADFTIVVTWAKFLGTYNDRLFELAGAVSLNNTAHIRMIWLNVDMQEGWKLTKDQKMEIK